MASLDLEDQIILALRRITRAIDLHSRELLQRYELTAPQLATLRAVERLQPISAGALARTIHLGQATLTGVLSRLQRRGLLNRTRGARDRRSVLIELTAEGERVLATAPSLLQERFRQELSRLQQWEQTQMLATLQRIGEMMLADEIAAAPLLTPGAAAAAPEDVSRYLDAAILSDEEGLPPARAAEEQDTQAAAEQPITPDQ